MITGFNLLVYFLLFVCLFVFIYIPFILRLFIEDSTIVKFRTKGRRIISENNLPSNCLSLDLSKEIPERNLDKAIRRLILTFESRIGVQSLRSKHQIIIV